MDDCAAPYCNNLAAEGYTMKRFSRYPKQQAVWVKNINREDWVAINNLLLCEINTFEFFTINEIFNINVIKTKM